MKGVAFLGDGKLEYKDFPDPRPSLSEVLVRMKATTICGSDVHLYKMDFWKKKPDWIGGHEAAGVIEEVGVGVNNVAVGDRVTIYHIFGCGWCEMCRKGYPTHCMRGMQRNMSLHWQGAFADLIAVPCFACIKLPDELSFIDGAILGCSGPTAYSILRRLRVSAHDTVALYGLGPVGLLATQIAKQLGAIVIGVDISEGRIKIAQNLGLDYAVNPSREDPAKRIKELTARKGGADVAVDSTANPDVAPLAINSVKAHGRVGIIGAYGRMREPTIAPEVFNRPVWVTGTSVSRVTYIFDLINLMLDHKFHIDKTVTHKFSLARVQEAFELFEKRQAGKIALIP